MAGRIEHYLSQLLQIHWLRPETALWRCFDCLLMERHGEVKGMAADLGCGDGFLSFIMAGGRVNNFDVCKDVDQIQGYVQGADIYASSTMAHLTVDDGDLRHTFSYGLDHKESLINKAGRLGRFYSQRRVHDLNRALPFAEQSFDVLFSNVLYWLEDVSQTLNDWGRKLRSGGKMILFVPNENFKEQAWLYFKAPHGGSRAYLNFFDRGYGALIKHCYSHEQWSALFKQSGLREERHVAYLGQPVMEVWNVGTRPIIPLLLSMAQRLGEDERDQVKREWIAYFKDFLQPMIVEEMSAGDGGENPAFHFYVLEKCA